MSYLSSVFSMRDTKPDNAPVSGGGLSEDLKFSYGYPSSPGKRSTMEDFFDTQICGVDGQLVGLFGVFDAVALSRDHKPNQIDERQRIEDAGGCHVGWYMACWGCPCCLAGIW